MPYDGDGMCWDPSQRSVSQCSIFPITHHSGRSGWSFGSRIAIISRESRRAHRAHDTRLNQLSIDWIVDTVYLGGTVSSRVHRLLNARDSVSAGLTWVTRVSEREELSLGIKDISKQNTFFQCKTINYLHKKGYPGIPSDPGGPGGPEGQRDD